MVFPTSASQDEGSDHLLSMNMTPLIGVILVLMMAIVVSVPRQRDMLLLSMPSSSHICNMTSAIVDVDFDNTILWDGNPVSQAELQQYLIAAVREEAAVHIIPSPMAKHAAVTALTRRMLEAGIQTINIALPLS